MKIKKDEYLKLLAEGNAEYDGNVVLIDAGVLGKFQKEA